jgi:hypothetical protein
MPFRFDAAALTGDVRSVGDAEWRRHFNTQYYQGDWSGVALRSTGGPSKLYPDPHAEFSTFADTEVLTRCPNVRAALANFRCPVRSVRFLRLGAGSEILEHQDYELGFEDGAVRFHVPVISGPGVDFVLAGEEIPMLPGECWYLNVNHPHRVKNAGSETRVHLVIDCLVDDWLRELMLTTARAQA